MKMRSTKPQKFNLDDVTDGAEFSVLNSQHYYNYHPVGGYEKSTLQTNVLYILSILSIASWFISLYFFPFGDVLQFLIGGIVLLINAYIFKYH